MKSLWIHRQLGWSHSRIASLGLCFFAVLLIPKAVLSQTSEKVVIASCYDGDTCTSSTGEKIRLACIDTPELRGKRAEPVPAKAARDHLRELVVGRKVNIRRITTDRYGRTVAELFVNGSNVQQQLVANRSVSLDPVGMRKRIQAYPSTGAYIMQSRRRSITSPLLLRPHFESQSIPMKSQLAVEQRGINWRCRRGGRDWHTRRSTARQNGWGC